MQHHIGLAHHFDTMEQQKGAATLGMWTFLVTEIMLFGGLLTAYLVYRWAYPDVFAAASGHLNMWLAAVNTTVLLVSSLTVALSVWNAEKGNFRNVVTLILLTIVLGFAFLGIKAIEYSEKFAHCADPAGHECLVPGRNFHFPTEGAASAATGETAGHAAVTAETKPQYQIFYVLYFAATGIHAIHMIIGIAVMSVIAWMAWRGRFTPDYYNPVEIGGLYWHLIDIVWVFLFPLFYLITGSHGG